MTFDLQGVPDDYRKKAEELSTLYKFTGDCAKGANGYILFGRNRQLDRRVAIKFYYWGDGAHVEPSYLAKLEHPNVIKIDHVEAIVTRYCEGGDLDSWISGPSTSLRQSVGVLQQVAGAVSYLHAQGFLHRDLKPSNIFCAGESQFVIGDFGSVVSLTDQGYAISHTKHSLIYRPPEDFVSNAFYRQGDIYQLGVLLYQLLGGYLPYEAEKWLTEAQLKKCAALQGFDSQIFVNSHFEKLISRGKLLAFPSIPYFVPRRLRAIIRRATREAYSDRYASVSDMLAELNNFLQASVEWIFEDGTWVAKGKRVDYRCVVMKAGRIQIEKRKSSGWRCDNTLHAGSLMVAAQLIEQNIE
jgi:eukaryotic-like serine/threonine-protein kinase